MLVSDCCMSRIRLSISLSITLPPFTEDKITFSILGMPNSFSYVALSSTDLLLLSTQRSSGVDSSEYLMIPTEQTPIARRETRITFTGWREIKRPCRKKYVCNHPFGLIIAGWKSIGCQLVLESGGAL